MTSPGQTGSSTALLRDNNTADINHFLIKSIPNNNSSSTPSLDSKYVMLSLPSPSKFPLGQQSQQPISSIVTNPAKMNGQKGPISSSDSNVNKPPGEYSAVPQDPRLESGTVYANKANTDSGAINPNNDNTDDDNHDDDADDHVFDETKALEGETKAEKRERQRLPSERLKEQQCTAAERRARQREELMRMIAPGKPKEYKLCGAVVILFIISLVMFIVVMSLRPLPNTDLFYLLGRPSEKLILNARTLEFSIRMDRGREIFSGQLWRSKSTIALPQECTNSSVESSLCLRWPDFEKLEISHTIDWEHDHNLSCFKFSWEALNDDVWHMDCFNLGGKSWFGGGLLQSGAWRVDRMTLNRVPFLTGSIHRPGSLGPVLERYWVTSEGVAFIMDDETPLQISINSIINQPNHESINQESSGDHVNQTDQSLCLYSDFESDLSNMYREALGHIGIDSSSASRQGSVAGSRRRHGPLKYSICLGASVHEALTRRSPAEVQFDSPTLPNTFRTLISAPVWSTRRNFRRQEMNDTSLLEYADMINEKGYGRSLLMIDSSWEESVGDLTFSMEKLSNAQETLAALRDKGFLISLSVGPHIGVSSSLFIKALNQGSFVKDIAGETPSLVRLWEEPKYANQKQDISSVIDITSEPASNWLRGRLRQLADQSVDSISVAGISTASLPAVPTFAKSLADLNEFTREACRAFSNIGPLFSSVQSAYKCQNFPVLIRLAESTSTWNETGGLNNVISSMLALNLIGYPFVISDPVGGEFSTTDDNKLQELYIRWMQVTAFFPVFHLSIPPHYYGNSTEIIAKDLLELRRITIIPELNRILDQAVVKNEKPSLIKPVWWISDNSTDPGFDVENEFIIGEKILVAPVLEQGKTRRSIYLPKGLWEDQINNLGGIHIGPKWLWNYKIPLSKVAYFIRKDLP